MNLHEQEPRGKRERVISMGEWITPFETYNGAFRNKGASFHGTAFYVREINDFGLCLPSLFPLSGDIDLDLDEEGNLLGEKGAYVLTPRGLMRYNNIDEKIVRTIEERFESKLLMIQFDSDSKFKESARRRMDPLEAMFRELFTETNENLPFEFQLRSPFGDFSHEVLMNSWGQVYVGDDWVNGQSESGRIFLPQISVPLIKGLEVRVIPSLK